VDLLLRCEDRWIPPNVVTTTPVVTPVDLAPEGTEADRDPEPIAAFH